MVPDFSHVQVKKLTEPRVTPYREMARTGDRVEGSTASRCRGYWRSVRSGCPILFRGSRLSTPKSPIGGPILHGTARVRRSPMLRLTDANMGFDQSGADNDFMAKALAESGIFVASIDFRMPPAAPHPGSAQDINPMTRSGIFGAHGCLRMPTPATPAAGRPRPAAQAHAKRARPPEGAIASSRFRP
jgi:hypothetical protein